MGKPEKAPGGELHVQGWVQFTKRKHMTAVLKVFPSRCFHVELCKGTEAENEKYCKKTETTQGEVVVFGEFTKQGKSSRLARVCEMVKEGIPMNVIWSEESEVMVKHFKGVNELKKQVNPPKEKKRFNTEDFPEWPQAADIDWSKTQRFVGTTGIGKTEYAISLLPNALLVRNLNAIKMYNPTIHSGIIFDDFDDQFFKMDESARIHLVDQDRDSDMRVMYQTYRIPAHTPKIFTSNAIDDGGWLLHPAVARRVIITELKEFKFTALEIHENAKETDREVIDLLSESDDEHSQPSQPGELVRCDAKTDWEPDRLWCADDISDFTDSQHSDMEPDEDDVLSDDPLESYFSRDRRSRDDGFTQHSSKKQKTN